MPTLLEYQEQLAVKSAELTTLADKPDPTPEDVTLGESISADIVTIEGNIKTIVEAKAKMSGFRDRAAEVARGLNEPATNIPFAGKALETGESETEKFLKKGPWKGLGHMAFELKACGDQRPGFVRDGNLGKWNAGVLKYDEFVKSQPKAIKAALGLNELSDSEGSAAVPVDLAAGIWARTAGEDNLLNRISPTPVAGNGLKIRAWNDASRTGDVLFGGARAYYVGEGQQGTKGTPSTRDIDLRLKKLFVLMYATDELLEDAPALEAELTRIAGACFVYKINKSIIRGPGGGEPQGLLNSACKVTQTAVVGQGAATIVAKNIDQMYSRRSPGSSTNMIWLYQIDAEQQLGALALATGSSSGQLVNMPATGLSMLPNEFLKKRPLVESEHCSALGTEGDIILWDPTQHIAIVKSNGINQAASMHLRFDYDETAFRFTFRFDAQSRWEAAMTPAQSSNTRSPIVTLNSSRT